MPTRTTSVRLAPDLLAVVRRELRLPEDALPAEVVRAAMRHVAGKPEQGGKSENRGGRPRKVTRESYREIIERNEDR